MIIQGTYYKHFLARGIQFFTGFLHPLLRLKKIKKTDNHFSVSTDDGAEYEAVWPVVERHAHYPVKHKSYREWYVPGNPKQVLEFMVGKGYQWNNFIFHIIKILTGVWLGPVNARQLYCVEVATRALRALGYKEVQVDWNNYQLQRWLEKQAADPNSPIREIANVSEEPGKLLSWLYKKFQTISSIRIGKKYLSFMTAGPIIFLWVTLWGVFKSYQLYMHEHLFWQPWPDYMFAGILFLMWSFSFTDWVKNYYNDHYPQRNKKVKP